MLNLTFANVQIEDPDLQDFFDDLQGNILKSHGRDFSKHLFLQFTGDAAAARAWVGSFAERVTSAKKQHADALDWKANGTEHMFTSLLLTAKGYETLGVDGAATPYEKAFRAGMKDTDTLYNTRPRGDHGPRANPLNDDPSDWEEPFQQDIHAVAMLSYGGDRADDEGALAALDAEVKRLREELDGVATVLCEQHGHVIRNERDQVIEHFGFTDGVSNPLFLMHDLDKAWESGAFDRYDGGMALDSILVKDPGAGRDAYGTFVVYRKLQQNVRGFATAVEELARKLAEAGGAEVTDDLAGAYVMGRFKDGTPVVEQSEPGWVSEPNNFDYDQDVTGLRCPMAAHARRSNPRGDAVRLFGEPPTIERARRITRRAISFGSPELDPAEEWTEQGLLFVCCQSNIEDQFIFLQTSWCNNEDFVSKGAGIDPVIGQLPKGREPEPQTWPSRWGRPHGDVQSAFSGFVRMRGGEYFFAPSISFMRGLGAAG
jgi:Dyp-type peroxidase family